MTSYLSEIKLCPECGGKFVSYALLSCNTIGAKLYTDGCVEGCMYDEGCPLLKCPCCGQYIWDREDKTLDAVKESNFSADDFLEDLPEDELEEYKKTDYYKECKRNENIQENAKSLPRAEGIYGDAFNDVFAHTPWKTAKQEKYIRIRVWWSFNGPFRPNNPYGFLYCVSANSPPKEFYLPDDQKENLGRLLDLLNAEETGDILTRAEILRQLGRFDECIKELDRPFHEQYLCAVTTIKNLAIAKKRQVDEVAAK